MPTKMPALGSNSGSRGGVPSGLCDVPNSTPAPSTSGLRAGLINVRGTELRHANSFPGPCSSALSPLISKYYEGKVRGVRPCHVFLASSLIKA